MAGNGIVYDLRHFNKTWATSSKANESDQAILDKWPYLCSRGALIIALADVATGTATQRNPNGYTAIEMADKMIGMFDEIMYAKWDNTAVFAPTTFPKASTHRWDQKAFWNDPETSFIYWSGSDDLNGDADDITDNHTEIVLLPSKQYTPSSIEYIANAYLGFDKNATKTATGVGSGSQNIVTNYGAELTFDANNRVTGIETTTPDRNNHYLSTDLPNEMGNPYFMAVISGEYYNPVLAPNGIENDTVTTPANWGDSNEFESDKYTQKANAKFQVTVSGNKVTAVTAVSQNDGDGDATTGGWGFDADDDYTALQFKNDDASELETTTATKVQPRILIRTDSDADTGLPGKKATVDITDTDTEFFAGEGLTNGTYDAYAVPNQTSSNYGKSLYGGPKTNLPVIEDYSEWYDRTLPLQVLPSTVRISLERPNLKTTSRSLRTKQAGTGAHRYAFELEYPPMTEAQADLFIDFFDAARGGARECQIFIPKPAVVYLEHLAYNKDLDVVSNFVQITGDKGDTQVKVKGNSSLRIDEGTLFNLDDKLYRCLSNSGQNLYGEDVWRIEPPLRKDYVDKDVRARTTNENRGKFMYVKALLVDDVLDYTVDAAGLFRFSMKFVEALEA